MGQIDLTSYKNIYLQTAKENIDSMLSSCAKLIENVQDKEAINSLHISSHTLKSKSQLMGFVNVAALCANIEKISNNIINGVSQIDDEFMVLLKNSIDEINLELIQIEKGDAKTHSASLGSA